MSNKKHKELLAMPYNWDLYLIIKHELECMGYDVSVVLNSYELSFFSKFLINFNELILKRKGLRQKLYGGLVAKMQLKNINKFGDYDICLIIQEQLFNEGVIRLMREKSKLTIAYYFDGVERFGGIQDNKIKYFDKVYVFDKKDIEKYPQYNLKLSHNFYFGNSIKSPLRKKTNIDFYYLASYNEDRVDIQNELTDYFNANKISYTFDISIPNNIVKYRNRNINRLKKAIPYNEFIKKMDKSRYILDIIVKDHSGLSFRIIESLIYKKKVVTTNPTVKEYDFYNSQNIFIIGERPLEELLDFLKSDYCEIDQKIVEKYSFQNWFNEITKN